jgi:hypothetical protein
MDINKYLKTIEDINILIESISTQDIEDVQSSIDRTKEKMDILNARIQSRLDQQTTQKSLPFTDITIDFINVTKISIRSAVEKTEYEFNGIEEFNVLDVNNDFLILQQDDWDERIGLILYHRNLNTNQRQRTDIQLFFNKYGNLTSGEKTRIGNKEESTFEIKRYR